MNLVELVELIDETQLPHLIYSIGSSQRNPPDFPDFIVGRRRGVDGERYIKVYPKGRWTLEEDLTYHADGFNSLPTLLSSLSERMDEFTHCKKLDVFMDRSGFSKSSLTFLFGWMSRTVSVKLVSL